MQALIFQEKVIQIENESFPVCKEMQWIDISSLSSQPQVGWGYLNGSFIQPPTPTPLAPSLPSYGALLEELYNDIKNNTLNSSGSFAVSLSNALSAISTYNITNKSNLTL